MIVTSSKYMKKKKCLRSAHGHFFTFYELFAFFRFDCFRKLLFWFRHIELRTATTAEPSVIPRDATDRVTVRTMNFINHIAPMP